MSVDSSLRYSLDSVEIEAVVKAAPVLDRVWIRWLLAENFQQVDLSDRGDFWRSIAPRGVNDCEITGREYWLPLTGYIEDNLGRLSWRGFDEVLDYETRQRLGVGAGFVADVLGMVRRWDYCDRIALEPSHRFTYCDRCSEWTDDGVRPEDDSHLVFCMPCADSNWYLSIVNEYWTNRDNCSTDDQEEEYSSALEAWKPCPQFFGASEAGSFYGLELEVEFEESNLSTRELIDRLQDDHWLGSNKGLWYHHSDGSLHNGIEFVSHPMSAEFFRSDLSLDWLQLLSAEGLRSWSTSTCGLHIHTSRAGFATDVHAFAFAQLFYQNAHQFERLAGRSSSRYASFDLEDRPPLALDIKRRASSGNRYVAVNFTNYATVEVRIFRGSLNERRVRSALELVSSAVEYTRDLTVRDLNSGALNWSRFVAFLESNNAPNAIHYVNLYNLRGE